MQKNIEKTKRSEKTKRLTKKHVKSIEKTKKPKKNKRFRALPGQVPRPSVGYTSFDAPQPYSV